MRRTPLKRQRDKPRRKAPERVTYTRVKEKAGAAPTAAEKRHIARVAAMPCLVCGAASTVHHVTADGFKRIARSHKRVVPLCPRHHQKVFDPSASDPISVEGLGHAGFAAKYGIDLLATADTLWEETMAAERPEIDRAIDDAERLFVASGQAKVKAEAMDLRRKRVRATLFVKYKGDGNPAGASEQMAEADPVYELACTDWENAAFDAETLRAQAEAKRMRFEAWRTANATERAKMQLR